MRLINPRCRRPDGKVAVCAGMFTVSGDRRKKNAPPSLCSATCPHPTTDGSFSVYDDLKKLLDAEASGGRNRLYPHSRLEAKKKELFAKVRAGQVQCYGKHAENGCRHERQDRLIALHDLDCPWRPAIFSSSGLEELSVRAMKMRRWKSIGM